MGQQPVNVLTQPASCSFSSMVPAAAAWVNLPKRVPVSAKPQLGVSILNSSSSAKSLSLSIFIPPVAGRRPLFDSISTGAVAGRADASASIRLRDPNVVRIVGRSRDGLSVGHDCPNHRLRIPKIVRRPHAAERPTLRASSRLLRNTSHSTGSAACSKRFMSVRTPTVTSSGRVG